MELIATDNTTYYLKDRGRTFEYPRVTSIINSCIPFLGSRFTSRDVLKRNQNFGRAVHKVCELDDIGQLKKETLDPQIGPYLQGWQKFRAKYTWAKTIMLRERVVVSRLYGFAGSPDVMFIKGNLVDIKSGDVGVTTGMQLAAYQCAIEEDTRMKVKKRYVVQLKPFGYDLHEFKDSRDLPRFKSCLTVYNAKKEWRVL